MQKKENELHSAWWRAEQRLSSQGRIVCFGWKRALAAGPRGHQGGRDPLAAPLGGPESQRTKAWLKNHCPVARSLSGLCERHFLCSHGGGKAEVSMRGREWGPPNRKHHAKCPAAHFAQATSYFQRQTSGRPATPLGDTQGKYLGFHVIDEENGAQKLK